MEKETMKESKKKKGDLLYRIVTIILAGIILFSLYKIGSLLYGYYEGSSQYKAVQKMATTEEKGDIDFDALKKANKDVKAWIRLEGTKINYPVLQTTNNEYYLYHMFNGEANGAGSIFIDYRNERPFEDFSTVLHGHRMKDGTMFKPLIQYSEADFYQEHKVIEITTPKQKYDCKVFAAATISAVSDLYQFQFHSQDDKADYLRRLEEINELETKVKVGPDDKLVMMSTCTAQLDDNRYCVFGKLVKAEAEK